MSYNTIQVILTDYKALTTKEAKCRGDKFDILPTVLFNDR